MTRPRLLILDQFSHLGGGQRALLEALPALREAFDPVLAVPGPGAFCDAAQELGISCELLDPGSYRAGRKSIADAARFAWRQPALARQIGKLARQHSADLIYANGPRLFVASAIASRREGTGLVWHLHLQLGRGGRGLMEAAARIRSPAMIACSNACLAEFAATSIIRKGATVIYGGVAPVVLPRNSGKEMPTLGVIGAIHPDKGQATLLHAAPEILRACPGTHFRIVGPVQSRAYAEMLRRLADTIPGPVEFSGPVPSPAEALRGLSAAIVPSNRESMGRVVLEAFSAGVPVIASDAGGLLELVNDGEDALLFPRGDAAALARSAIRVLQDGMLRARLTAAGRKSYQERWRPECFHHLTVRVIAEELKRRREGRRPR